MNLRTDFKRGSSVRVASVTAEMLDNNFKYIESLFCELFTENRELKKRLDNLDGNKQIMLETIGKGECKECKEKTHLYNHKNNIICGDCACLEKFNI